MFLQQSVYEILIMINTVIVTSFCAYDGCYNEAVH